MSDNQQPSFRVCKKCGATKAIELFAKVYAKNSRGQNYYAHSCLDCFRKEHAEKESRRRKANPEQYKKYRKDCRARDPEKARRQRRESGHRLRDLVFEAYGGFSCACCGETCKSMLTIDHINGDGNKHRKQLAAGKPYASARSGLGDYLYRDLRDRGFPKGFQVLCYNCNLSKHRLGRCEHSIEGSTTIPQGSTPQTIGGGNASYPSGVVI